VISSLLITTPPWLIRLVFALTFLQERHITKAYYHKVKLNEVKWRIDAENYLAKNKHLELQEKI
jgi:hypothetical protein